jgi:hypothetical protein
MMEMDILTAGGGNLPIGKSRDSAEEAVKKA